MPYPEVKGVLRMRWSTTTDWLELRGATDVPLGVMRLSAMALQHAQAIAEHGHRAAFSDAGVAVALLAAGARGARLNVDVNLGSLGDESYVEAVKAETGRLANDAARSADASRDVTRR